MLASTTQTAPVPPQNLDAEESVLGAMMLSPGAIGAVSEVLDAGDFYRESHAKIYRATLSLYARGEPVEEPEADAEPGAEIAAEAEPAPEESQEAN